MNECHVKVIDELQSQRSKQEMTTSTHHVSQVNKIMSHLISTKYQLVKQKQIFYSTIVARRQVVQDVAS